MKYRFKVVRFENYDGDSFNLTLDLGFELIVHKKCRLAGADTPEIQGGTKLSKAAGKLAKRYVYDWCWKAMSYGTLYFSSELYTGKYGRPLGDLIKSEDGDEESLRWALFTEHLAVPYDGENKADLTEKHAANFEKLKEKGRL